MCIQIPITIYTTHTVSVSAYLENGSEYHGFTSKIGICVDPRFDEESIWPDIKQLAISRPLDGKFLDPIYTYNRRMKI